MLRNSQRRLLRSRSTSREYRKFPVGRTARLRVYRDRGAGKIAFEFPRRREGAGQAGGKKARDEERRRTERAFDRRGWSVPRDNRERRGPVKGGSSGGSGAEDERGKATGRGLAGRPAVNQPRARLPISSLIISDNFFEGRANCGGCWLRPPSPSPIPPPRKSS